jgi:hypothetical protein
MSALLMLLGAVLAALLGCVFLALSQHRHWRAVTRSSSAPGRAPRRLGLILLTACVVLTLLRDGASFAALFSPVLIGSAALITAMVLTWAPHLLRPITRMFDPKRL